MLRRARRLLVPCRANGVKLLVNGRVDVVLAACCDGVHLPGDGIPPSEARRILPRGALVGRSVHREEEIPAGRDADFLFFGPVFDTPSKRAFGAPQGLGELARFRSLVDRPVIAVGGIDPRRVAEVLEAGASGVAAIGGVLGAPDPGAAVAAFVEALRLPS
ncbi:thiamine phosphate synthase [bacterium]|nr:thiamine phosphate synthase [bacterium]